MGNGRPISNQRRFQSCLYDKDVVTTHDVGTTHVECSTLYSECDNENNQSTHMCMNRTKKDFLEAAFCYYSCSGARKKSIKVHRPKTPLAACVFHVVLIYSCFCPNANRCTCFWHLPKSSYFGPGTYIRRAGK